MTDWFRQWILGIVAAAVCIALLRELVPKGAAGTVMRISGGVVLFLVMVRPLTGIDAAELHLRYIDYQQQIDRQIEVYQKEYDRQMEESIAKETGAYISKRAAQMGIVCTAVVETQQKEGLVLPVAVALDIPRDESLSSWIAREIGINPGQQYWEGEG